MTRRTMKSRLAPVLALGACAPLALALVEGPAVAAPETPNPAGAAAEAAVPDEPDVEYVVVSRPGRLTQQQSEDGDATISSGKLADILEVSLGTSSEQQARCDAELSLVRYGEGARCVLDGPDGGVVYWARAARSIQDGNDYTVVYGKGGALGSGAVMALNNGRNAVQALDRSFGEQFADGRTLLDAEFAVERVNRLLEARNSQFRVTELNGPLDLSSPNAPRVTVHDAYTGRTRTAYLLPLPVEGEGQGPLISVDLV